MPSFSPDILYAYARLGLEAGAAPENIQAVLLNAGRYHFSTRARVRQVQHFVEFFAARAEFGGPGQPFSAIRKIYHEKALALHPDRHAGDKAAEEQLKTINVAFHLVEGVYREAQDYFKQDEAVRHEIEEQARQARMREAPEKPKKKKDESTRAAGSHAASEVHREETQAAPKTESPHRAAKFMAASVPRFIRNSRLFYLPRHAIIGSRLVRPAGSAGMVYDVIMLPEIEFRRLRLYLGTETAAMPELGLSKLTPAYIPIDTKEVFVPAGETDPWHYARDYFVKEFGLSGAA